MFHACMARRPRTLCAGAAEFAIPCMNGIKSCDLHACGMHAWNPETKKAFMSRSVVFNESVMYFDKLSSNVLPDFSEEQVRVEVEHSVEKENVTVDNNGAATSDDSDPDSAVHLPAHRLPDPVFFQRREIHDQLFRFFPPLV